MRDLREPQLATIPLVVLATVLTACLGVAAYQAGRGADRPAAGIPPPKLLVQDGDGLSQKTKVSGDAPAENPQRASGDGAPPREAAVDAYAEQRRQMVQQQLRSRDVTDARVLEAMERVPRHEFVPERLRSIAYADHPLPIGHEQTISQPYIVALMTQLVRPKPTDRALDVGTGSGYQAAVLAELCKQVYGIEILPPLAKAAGDRLAKLGYKNVEVRCGDGYRGWPEHAPFDVIIVAAAPDHIPKPLLGQLAVGGRLVIPVGRYYQDLIVVEKQRDGKIRQWKAAPVVFVPMTGEARKRDQP